MSVVCTPSGLLKAANCFPCLTTKQLNSIRSFLACSYANAKGCVKPSAPTGLAAVTPSTSDLPIIWNQPVSTVAVDSFIIIWGTAPGSSNLGSAILPANIPAGVGPTGETFDLTPLPAGTTIFFSVQAVSAGCASAATSGSGATLAANGLLNGLVHFYQFQEAASPFIDSGADPISLQYTNAGQNFARVAGHVQAFAGGYADSSGPNKVGTIAAAPFDYTGDGTGNLSMTFCFWCKFVGAAGAQPGTGTLVSVWTGAYFFALTGSNNFQFNINANQGGGPTITVNSAFVYDNNWHLVVGGFDKTNGVIFMSIDNGAKITAACAQMTSINSRDYAIGNCGACGGNNLNWDFSDCGTWLNRALTAADINNLWNGGAGLPFSQFTN